MFVIIRTDQGGGYVAERGSPDRYTKHLEETATWYTRDQAERERRENETVVDVGNLFYPSTIY